jgi:hypothetical protein
VSVQEDGPNYESAPAEEEEAPYCDDIPFEELANYIAIPDYPQIAIEPRYEPAPSFPLPSFPE